MTRANRKPERIRPDEKLKDIASWEVLFAFCRCEHHAEIDVRRLRRKFDEDTELRKLEPKLSCEKCKQTGKAQFFVTRMLR
jgi:hypothetical protein